MKCPHCGAVILQERRRQPQSNLVHKLIAEIARQLGEDQERLKVILKLRCGAWLPHPVPILPEWPGKFVYGEWVWEIAGHAAVYLKSESAYTKDEETALIAEAKTYAYANQLDLGKLGEP